MNFFQPSFKLAAKHRDGARVTKRYHPPQTPCERLLQAEDISAATKSTLREIAADLDPLKLLEEMRAWRQQSVRRLIGEVSLLPPHFASDLSLLAAGNILSEAARNRIT